MAKKKRVNQLVAGELRGFIERFERLTAEMAEIADQRKEVMAEAKGRGYDTKVMRLVIRERARDPAELAEERTIAALYRDALGMEGTPLDDRAKDAAPEPAPEAAPSPKRRSRKAEREDAEVARAQGIPFLDEVTRANIAGAQAALRRKAGESGDEPPPPEAA